MYFEEKLPSDRKFGFLFFFIFVFIGWYLSDYQLSLQEYCFGFFSFSFLISACFRPNILRPVNKLWMLFGNLLSFIIQPIILGILFYLIITPVAIILKIIKRDELKLKLNNDDSHWKKKPPYETDSTWFKQQF